MRRGFTLPELLSVVAIVGILTAVVTPPLIRYLDQASVREGVERFAALYATTRQLAISRGTLARLELERTAPVATLSVQRAPAAWDTVGVYPLGSSTVTCSNLAIVFGPLGLGYGTSNTRVIFSRGASADTVTTSRTGRLRR
ncbi:MAG TPA: prepilin-type N-terminal cleavage/methylation domain-containing protein [Gemmatimonadales bacterium]|nr:prepilin-type N-terminal cleavage/methylation domain-containing protein [Gemmatimonadales bacterium]